MVVYRECEEALDEEFEKRKVSEGFEREMRES